MKIRWMLTSALAMSMLASAAVAQPDEPFGPLPQPRGAYLGVRAIDVNHERATALKLKEESGVEVIVVDRDAPAAKAGVREHDVLVTYNGVKIESDAQLRRLVHETPMGREVAITVMRDGQPLNMKLKLADRRELAATMSRRHMNEGRRSLDQMPPMGRGFFSREDGMRSPEGPGGGARFPAAARAGMMIEGLTPQLAEFFGLSNGLNGVLVRDVEKDGPAAKAGLKAGDVILEINKRKIADPRDIFPVIREGGDLAIHLLRDKKEMNVTLKLPEHKRAAEEEPSQDFSASLEELDRQMERMAPRFEAPIFAMQFAPFPSLPFPPPALTPEMMRQLDTMREELEEMESY